MDGDGPGVGHALKRLHLLRHHLAVLDAVPAATIGVVQLQRRQVKGGRGTLQRKCFAVEADLDHVGPVQRARRLAARVRDPHRVHIVQHIQLVLQLRGRGVERNVVGHRTSEIDRKIALIGPAAERLHLHLTARRFGGGQLHKGARDRAHQIVTHTWDAGAGGGREVGENHAGGVEASTNKPAVGCGARPAIRGIHLHVWQVASRPCDLDVVEGDRHLVGGASIRAEHVAAAVADCHLVDGGQRLQLHLQEGGWCVVGDVHQRLAIEGQREAATRGHARAPLHLLRLHGLGGSRQRGNVVELGVELHRNDGAALSARSAGGHGGPGGHIHVPKPHCHRAHAQLLDHGGQLAGGAVKRDVALAAGAEREREGARRSRAVGILQLRSRVQRHQLPLVARQAARERH
mmetsp:Transcript_3041/g.9362  ORF Transcript_3041/g.9362 Transcript_3041/m.9362 type:complete len:404 (-) Transcript_3041:1231-2442(-)